MCSENVSNGKHKNVSQDAFYDATTVHVLKSFEMVYGQTKHICSMIRRYTDYS